MRWNIVVVLVAALQHMLVAVLMASEGVRAPNVVILLADDLGYQDVGCYNGPVNTPAIDALARHGARFTDFYSGCAVCSPSRAVLLTGRQHIRTGVYSWIHDESQKSHLLEREITLAEALKAEGYTTAHVGKWHLGLPSKVHDKPTPQDHGFDHWFATSNNAIPSHHQPNNFIRNGTAVGQLDGYSCDIIVEEAIDWLNKRPDGKPFYLNVWFHEPHAPIAAPEHAVTPYGNVDDRAAIYSGTIHNTDRAIDRLIKHLHRIAPPEDTVIVYSSDNGSYRDDRTGGLRGRKGSNWEGGIRVPGIFYWPSHIRPSVQTTPAGLVDVLPTICGLANVPAPERHLDGSNLSSLLLGKSDSFERHQPLFWHLQKSRPIVAMRSGNWCIVADPAFPLSTNNMFQESWIPSIRTGTYTNFRLFDLASDRQQATDVSKQFPETFQKLQQSLLKINESVMADGKVW